MSRTLIALLLLGSLAVSFQLVEGCGCELKSDSKLAEKIEQSLLELKDLLFIHFDDCEDALNKGFSKSGVYRIKPKTSFRPFKVWCDMASEGGGWTVIQTRFDGLIDFYRTWKEYRNGFGSVDSEHWLGNNFIRHITHNKDYELKIDLTGFKENEIASAKYSPFAIGSEDEKYKLYIGNFSSKGDILNYFSTIAFPFTTRDNDNDSNPNNCADLAQGAWWHSSCTTSNLNGIWMTEGQSMATRGEVESPNNRIGIIWLNSFGVKFYSLKSVEMKVRKIRNNC